MRGSYSKTSGALMPVAAGFVAAAFVLWALRELAVAAFGG